PFIRTVTDLLELLGQVSSSAASAGMNPAEFNAWDWIQQQSGRQRGGSAGLEAALAAPQVYLPPTRSAAPAGAGDSYVIQVQLPEAAIGSPAAARQAGENFGDAIARRLRERG